MKKASKRIGQYFNENHDLERDIEEFLDETAPLIGYIVHFFNTLEQSLDSAICEHINDRSDTPGALIIHKLSFSAKVELFNRLIRNLEIGFNIKLPSFDNLIHDLKKCGTLRNAVVHADWNHVDEEGYTYVKLDINQNGIQQHYWQFSVESMWEIIELIKETNLTFDSYYDERERLIYS